MRGIVAQNSNNTYANDEGKSNKNLIGSVFPFMLPVASKCRVEMSEGVEIREPLRSKPYILLVDDEDHFRVALTKQLSVRGYEILDVSNGGDAVKTVQSKRPDVVILDHKMPKMDGVQTLRAIKKICPNIKVIMLTGYGGSETLKDIERLGVFYHSYKPCGIEDLIEKIEEARKGFNEEEQGNKTEKNGNKEAGWFRGDWGNQGHGKRRIPLKLSVYIAAVLGLGLAAIWLWAFTGD